MNIIISSLYQKYLLQLHSSHRLEKYLKMKGFLEKALQIEFTLKSAWKLLLGFEKYLNFNIFCKTTLLMQTKISI